MVGLPYREHAGSNQPNRNKLAVIPLLSTMHHAHHGSSRLRGRGRKDRRDHMVVRISNFESNDAIPCACHEVLMWRNAVEDINSKES